MAYSELKSNMLIVTHSSELTFSENTLLTPAGFPVISLVEDGDGDDLSLRGWFSAMIERFRHHHLDKDYAEKTVNEVVDVVLLFFQPEL